MKKLVLCVLIILLAVPLQNPPTLAEEGVINACVNKDGNIKIIGPEFKNQQCSRNWKPLSWNIQGVQGPIGQQGPQGLQGHSGLNLHLFDGNDQYLGIFLSLNQEMFTTFLPQENVIIDFSKHYNNFGDVIRLRQEEIQFTEVNCSGNPYTIRTSVAADTLMKAAQGLYYKVTTDPVVVLITTSRMNSGGCNNTSSRDSLRRLEQVSIPFTEPVAWPLEIRTE